MKLREARAAGVGVKGRGGGKDRAGVVPVDVLEEVGGNRPTALRAVGELMRAAADIELGHNRITADETIMTEITFRSSRLRKSATLCSCSGPLRHELPALLSRMSTPPISSTILPTESKISCGVPSYI